MNFSAVDPKMKSPIIKENKNKADERMAKIEKRPKDPAPGDINDMETWKKFCTRRNEFKVSQFKREHFTDTYKKSKEWIPGPGKHFVAIEKFDKLSRSPPSIKVQRH